MRTSARGRASSPPWPSGQEWWWPRLDVSASGAQLWRRVVFFVCVSNVDDHLRNHGFLFEPNGCSLAPAYDVNPVATAGGLTLNISETDNAQDLALVREVAPFFRLKPRRADAIVREVVGAVRGWRAQAKAAGLGRAEQDRLASAFDASARSEP